MELAYKRILLKVSGEVFKSDEEGGIDGERLISLAKRIEKLVEMGVEIAMVIGGGNIWRYRNFNHLQLSRVTSDSLGMMATCMNAAAFKDALSSVGVSAVAMTSFPCGGLLENYESTKAKDYLREGRVVICAGGTGNPYFTTDSAAALRTLELDCNLLMKATKVDYVYDSDPMINKDAVKLEDVTYSEVLDRRLQVMDLTCAALMMEGDVPMIVFNVFKEGLMERIVQGEKVGTFIHGK